MLLPLLSVFVVNVRPVSFLIVIVAFGSGLPSSPITWPVTLFPCAAADPANSKRNAKSVNPTLANRFIFVCSSLSTSKIIAPRSPGRESDRPAPLRRTLATAGGNCRKSRRRRLQTGSKTTSDRTELPTPRPASRSRSSSSRLRASRSQSVSPDAYPAGLPPQTHDNTEDGNPGSPNYPAPPPQ